MIVISSTELRNNTKKHLDLVEETIVIQRGRKEKFVLRSEQRLMQDTGLARAITMNELLAQVKATNMFSQFFNKCHFLANL